MTETKKYFKVYKSSAGSGKTTTLVMEYLRLAIPNPSGFGEIVGITFTIKATNEMKSRVLETLENIIDNGEDFDPICSLIYEQVRLEHGFTKQIFIEKAQQLLQNILHGYSNFAFSTIDSFVVRIVKSFAFDLKLPLNFDIELDSNIIIDEAVSALISKAGYDDRLTKNLIKYIENQADEGADTRLHILVASLAKVIFNDSYSEFQKAIGAISLNELQSFANNIIRRRALLFNHIKQIGQDAVSLIQMHNIDFSSFFYGKSGGIPAYFNYLKDGRIDKFTPGTRSQTTINEDKWFTSKVPLDIQSEIINISGELTTYFQEVQPLIPEFIALHLLRQNIDAILLLGEVNHEIQNYYQENSVIHISETVKRVAEVVAKEQMPFIYERIGAKYRHFLIDEFQDTSVMQWRNLVPLLDNSLSEGNYNLVVGDAKQSIYRWRGGDFNQFIDLPNLLGAESDVLLKDRETNLKLNFDEVVLGNNYRSNKAIVSFNNSYFDFVKKNSNEIVQRVFEAHEQAIFQKETGYVELDFLPNHKLDEEKFQRKILGIIQDLLSRNFSYRDITILARKNDQLSYLADFLLANGIPIISSNSLKIFSSIHIQFIVNFIRWMNDKADKISRTAILFYWLAEGYLSKDEFDMFIKAESDVALLVFIFGEEDNRDRLAGSNDVALLIEFLADSFELFDKEYAFVIQLLSFATMAESQEGQGYMNFLEYVDKKSKDEFLAMPENLDALNLMTIHKSKGLEFPIVIWIDFVKSAQKNDFLSLTMDPVGIKKPERILVQDVNLLRESVFSQQKEMADDLSLADQINVAYVALTRPKKELYIIAEDKSTYHKSLSDFVENDNFFKENIDEETFVYGVKVIKQKQEDLDADENVIINKNFIPWYQRMAVNKSFVEEIDNEGAIALKKEGIKIHALLSKIVRINDIELLLDKEISQGRLKSQERDIYANQLYKIVHTPSVELYFQEPWEVVNERAIITSEQRIYRPDRVLISKDDIVIIDYKFSDYQSASDSQKNDYNLQIEKYISLLQEIYPDKKVSGKILWLKGLIYLEEIMKL